MTTNEATARAKFASAVRSCSASLPLPILHADSAPCWQALRVAAAADPAVQAMVVRAYKSFLFENLSSVELAQMLSLRFDRDAAAIGEGRVTLNPAAPAEGEGL